MESNKAIVSRRRPAGKRRIPNKSPNPGGSRHARANSRHAMAQEVCVHANYFNRAPILQVSLIS